MSPVDRIVSSVNMKRRSGRPRLRTPANEQEIISRCVKAARPTRHLPSDEGLGRAVGLGEGTAGDIIRAAG